MAPSLYRTLQTSAFITVCPPVPHINWLLATDGPFMHHTDVALERSDVCTAMIVFCHQVDLSK